MNSLLFILRYTLPSCLMLLLIVFWLGYLFLLPMLAADSLFGSNDALEHRLICSDWNPVGEEMHRRCTVSLGIHKLEFIQVAVTEPGGRLKVVPRDIHSQTNVGQAILWTMAFLAILSVIWLLWQKAFSIVLSVWPLRNSDTNLEVK